MFARREKLTGVAALREALWPRGGWPRALKAMALRLARLPGSAHRVALGVAIGVFVCFTPFFGLHMALATLLVLALRGNLMAALAGTFFGNPLTFGPIAIGAMELGSRLLRLGPPPGPEHVMGELGRASEQLLAHLAAPFTGAAPGWAAVQAAFDGVLLPYALGGGLLGLMAGLIVYLGTRSLLQRWRTGRMKGARTGLRHAAVTPGGEDRRR